VSRADTPPFALTWRLVTALSTVLIGTGALVATVSIRSFAWVVVAGLAFGTAAHVAIAVVAFSRTMRRPWPQITPLADDDWDD
jgi:hypothetical protein